MGGPLLGAYTMRSFGEFPSAARGSRLSRILEEAPLPKYCLSARACSGILRRAAQRKKILPEALDQALKYQVGLSAFKNEQENQGGGKGILIQDEHTGALSTFNNQAVCYDARGNGDGQTVPTITGDHNNRVTDYSALLFEPCNWDGEQVAPTLTQNNAGGGQRMPDKENFNAVLDVAYGLDRASFNQGVNTQYNFSVDEELIGSMTAKGPGAVCNSVVRRLTPTEEERLQGFPDGWTDIGEWVDSNGKRHKEADTPRYKALGNSIALPFWEWMAVRMLGCLGAYRPTMASLFDGIGGFPLAFSRAGCKPVWASEIEEFPIAVTKIRFPEED
jgi:DNA (cytosine-5)-methyltransferase 1